MCLVLALANVDVSGPRVIDVLLVRNRGEEASTEDSLMLEVDRLEGAVTELSVANEDVKLNDVACWVLLAGDFLEVDVSVTSDDELILAIEDIKLELPPR